MKITKLFSFLVIVFCLFVIPVSAFTDDFEDQDILDWTVISGVWVAGNGTGIEGINDYYLYNNQVAGGTSEIEIETTGVEDKYIEFNFKSSGSSGLGGASTATTNIYLFNDGVTGHGFTIAATSTLQTIDAVGWAYNPYSFSVNTWYKITITRTSTNIKVDIYDISDNLLDTQTSAYTLLSNADRINIDNVANIGGSISIYIDNIFTSNVAPSVINGIEWDEDQYTEGDTASYSWNLQNTFWQDLIYKYRVQILKDGSEIDTVKVSQTGTRYQDVDDAGTYEVKLQYSGLIFTNWIDADSDSVNVIPEVDSYINVPPTAYTTDSFEISYMYGRTPLGPFLKISKQIPSETGDYTYAAVDYDYLKDQNIVGGTVYTPNLTIFESGTYLIGIYDINLLTESRSTLVASDTIKIFYQDAIARINITESKIDTSNITTIGLGDILFGNYQIDSLNYTTGPIRLEMYNYENDVLSFSIPKQEPKGSYELPIKNLEYFVEVKDGHETFYKVDALFYTGNNQVRLARYDPDGTYNQTLAYTNVTIDYVNSAGYSLTLSKHTVVQRELFTISVKCPTTSQLVIFDEDGYVITDETLSGNINIPYRLMVKGKYSIQLYDPSTNLQCIESITVNVGVVDEDEDEEEEDVAFDTSFDSMLSSGSFIALLIIIACVGAFGKIGGVIGVFLGMVVGISISFLMGYLPAWILFIMVLALCVVFVSKLINSFGGGE